MPRKFTTTHTVTVTLPDEGSYDWSAYSNEAVRDRLATVPGADEGDATALEIARAMAHDYAERGASCTASAYVEAESFETVEVFNI